MFRTLFKKRKKKFDFHFDLPHFRAHRKKHFWENPFSFERHRISLRNVIYKYHEALIAGFGVFAVGVLIFGVWQSIESRPHASLELRLEAAQAVHGTINPDATFVLHTSSKLSSSEIRRLLHISPPTKFSVQRITGAFLLVPPAFAASSEVKQGGASYQIKPAQQLQKDTVYTFSVSDPSFVAREYSWAFQVQGPFSILKTLPANHSTDVRVSAPIEIAFNRDEFALQNPHQSFAISPPARGRLEYHGGTMDFIPEKLKPATVYTVTLKQGAINQINQTEILPSDYQFSFETENTASLQPLSIWFPHNGFAESLPNKKADIEFFAPSEMGDKELEARVSVTPYRITDPKDFLQLYKDYAEQNLSWTHYQTGTTGSSNFVPRLKTFGHVVASFHPVIATAGLAKMMQTPEAMSEGYYILDTVADGAHHAYLWLQVSPISYYYAISPEKSFVWLYDSPKTLPIGPATVSFLEDDGTSRDLGAPDQEGLLEFASPASLQRGSGNALRGAFLKVTAASPQPFFIPLDQEDHSTKSVPYWNHLSTDRPVYRMDDTVQYWGFIQGYRDDVRGKKARMALYESMTPQMRAADEQEIIGEDIIIAPDGTVHGKLPLKGISPSFYTLAFSLDGIAISTVPIHVVPYHKPAYALSMKARSPALFAGASAVFDISASLLDGTPVPNLKLVINRDQKKIITLDASGHATIAESTAYDPEAIYPTIKEWHVSPMMADEEDTSTWASVMVYGPKIVATPSFDVVDEATNRASVLVENIAFSGDNRPSESFGPEQGITRTPAVRTAVHAKVIKRVFSKKEAGTQYDPFEHKMAPRFMYESKDEILRELDGTTDGSGVFSFDQPRDESTVGYSNVFVEFSSADGSGRTANSRGFFSSMYTPNDSAEVTLGVADGHFAAIPTTQKDVSLGERVGMSVTAMRGGVPVPFSRVLVYQARQSIARVWVQQTAAFEEIVDEKFAPSAEYRAVIAGPFGFAESFPTVLTVKKEEKELHVETTSDKAVYAPGETAHLAITVKDKNGAPAQAAVNVSVVDETIFQLSDPLGNTALGDITGEHAPNVHGRTSSYMVSAGGGGEGSGGEESGGSAHAARSFFADTAAFESVHTGSDGTASISVKLPEFTTSWRVTTQAFSVQNTMAGDTKTSISTAVPFSVGVNMHDRYLSGDAPIMRMRVFGTSFILGRETAISVKSTTLGIEKTFTTTQAAVDIPIGRLSEGTHVVQITAQQGANRSSIARHIDVAQAYVQSAHLSSYRVNKELTSIAGNPTGATSILFTDRTRAEYYKELRALLCGCSLRADRTAAESIARQLMHTYFGERAAAQPLDLTHYQKENGGLSLAPYGDADVELSAYLADGAENGINKKLLLSYLQTAITARTADIHQTARALYGLAALHQPVLSKLYSAKDQKGLTRQDATFLALALARLGDKETARALYESSLKVRTTLQGGVPMLAEDALATLSQKERASLAMLASALFAKDDLSALLQSLGEDSGGGSGLALERTIIAREQLAALPLVLQGTPARISYETRNRRDALVLGGHASASIVLGADDIQTLRFTDVRGDVVAVVSYDVPMQTSNRVPSSIMSLRREYRINGRPMKTAQEGDIVRVMLVPSIDSRAPAGRYQIIDALPAGLVPLTESYANSLREGDTVKDGQCQQSWYPEKIVDNLVYLNIGKGQGTASGCAHQTLYYDARVMNRGVYTLQPALLQSLENPAFSTSADTPHAVTIQ